MAMLLDFVGLRVVFGKRYRYCFCVGFGVATVGYGFMCQLLSFWFGLCCSRVWKGFRPKKIPARSGGGLLWWHARSTRQMWKVLCHEGIVTCATVTILDVYRHELGCQFSWETLFYEAHYNPLASFAQPIVTCWMTEIFQAQKIGTAASFCKSHSFFVLQQGSLNGDHEARQAWETRRQRRPEQPRMEIMKRDKLGRQGGSGGQEQPRMEIMKGDKLGRQGCSGSQEQPKREIRKGDKLRDKAAAKSSPEWRSWRETNEARQGGSGSQEQPRMEVMKGDKWQETRRQRHHDHLAILGISNPVIEK